MKKNKIATLIKKADIADKFIDKATEIAKSLGYQTDLSYNWGKDTIQTLVITEDLKTVLVLQAIITTSPYNYIRVKDNTGKVLKELSIRADNFDYSVVTPILDFVAETLQKQKMPKQPEQHKPNLTTAEQVYDYGEENNWQNLTNKEYAILAQDINLARMAVADMQDKEIIVPTILIKFRRNSMNLKQVVMNKIAETKKQNVSKEELWRQIQHDMGNDIDSSKKIKVKKQADEDVDVKLKVQKNKPAGLDTSSPKSLPESIRPMVQDLKGKLSDVKEIETQLAARKAELDAKYQQAKNESKIVEKQAEIENLTNNIGKLLFAAKNETFQFQDNLIALTHQVKTVPAKATDKWKFEKVFGKLKELMGDTNAQKFLDNTLNGLQSQATEKVITELNIFSPTQKQMKTSDTSDTNKFIDALKEIYVNLRNYYLDVKKANNIVEDELLVGATASKGSKLSKKAKMQKKAEYKAEEDVLFQMLEDFEICTPEEISLCQAGWGRNIETAETMLYIRTGLRNLEQLKDDLISSGIDEETVNSYVVGDVEDTEIESSKKVKMVKKAKIGKKAGTMVKMELPLANYMDMLQDRAKEIGRQLYMAEELESYFEGVDTVLEPYIFVDNYLINGEFADKETWQEDYSDKYEKYNGDWNEFCANEAVFYNEDEACLDLGV